MSDASCHVLFVCTGNICRSPAAEVIARKRASSLAGGRSLVFSSAGTASWHVGDDMDPRAAIALEAAGYPPPRHVAQHATDELLASSDMIIALDRKHHQILKGRLPAERHEVLRLLRPFDPASGGAQDVADPYYGTDEDFRRSIAIIDASVEALVASLSPASTD
jgi:protein-tyrosine phosphatase